jgi:hypothetical protein
VPLGIVVLELELLVLSASVSLPPLCGCCTPGSVVVVVLVPVVALASGIGCCTPGSVAPMVALASLSVAI